MAALEVHSITRRYEDRLAVDGLSFTWSPGPSSGSWVRTGGRRPRSGASPASCPCRRGGSSWTGGPGGAGARRPSGGSRTCPTSPRLRGAHRRGAPRLHRSSLRAEGLARAPRSSSSASSSPNAVTPSVWSLARMRQKLSLLRLLSDPRWCCSTSPCPASTPRDPRRASRDPRAQGARRGVVLSSHLLDLIEALADRLLILDRGRALRGTLQEARSAAEGASWRTSSSR